jgi:hypothetical protein
LAGRQTPTGANLDPRREPRSKSLIADNLQDLSWHIGNERR